MILELRNRHIKIWLVIAVLLPCLFFLAWSVIPEQTFEFTAPGEQEIQVKYHLKSQGLMELEIKYPMTSPGNLLLWGETAESNFEDCLVIGHIPGSGSYEFKVPEQINEGYLLLYDPFSKTITDSIKL